MEPSEALFRSIDRWRRVQELIDAGQPEGPYLEAKAPTSPQLTRDQKSQFAQAISGFANTGGGVILWGVSTTRHAHSGLDVLTQAEPLGNAAHFAHEVDTAAPTLAYPGLPYIPSQVLRRRSSDTRGMVVTYVPRTAGDPVQSVSDRRFYFRSGDDFPEMPYDMLRRMFSATASPDLAPIFDARLVELNEDQSWSIPILLLNQSSAAARDAKIHVEFLNSEAIDSITSPNFRDVSGVNPGHRMFETDLNGPVFRGLNVVAGTLRVAMLRGQRPRRRLDLAINIYASGMPAQRWELRINLAKAGFTVRQARRDYLY
jgi:hypothetical protein